MIIITENAKNEIAKNARFLKITVERGGCVGFQYNIEYKNEQEEGDLQLNELILTDQKSQLLVENVELDFIDEIDKCEFVFKNQKASKTCGCGTSFEF